VLPSPDGRSLLLAHDGAAWSLPHVICDKGWLADAVDDIRTAFHERYGVDAIVLRILQWTPTSVAIELEALSGTPRGEWGDLADSLPVQLWRDDRGWEQRVEPWQRRGWFNETVAWIAARVTPLRTPRQVKAGWNGSCVLRVDTNGGVLFFKASPKRLPPESAVIRELSVNWSRNVPPVIDADEERCWMLMRDAGGTPIDVRNPAMLAEAAGLMARIQLDQAPHAGRWAAMGCPDRSLDVLRSRLERLLVQIPAQLHSAGVITQAERSELVSFVPRADAICGALASYAVPRRSIHHEDFRDGNAHRTASGTIVFIDWVDTVIAHPFFTIQRFLWFMPPPPGIPRHRIDKGKSDAARRTIRDAYLDELRRFESRSRLQDAFSLSSQLSPIYDALRFDSLGDTDATFRRGLTPDEARNARVVMAQMLEVCRG